MRKLFLPIFTLLFALCAYSQTNINMTCLVTLKVTNNGGLPYSGLLLANDGNFYGTTYMGGPYQTDSGVSCGTAFKMTPDGAFTTLANFGNGSGYWPMGQSVQAHDGNFYGTTIEGGNLGGGTVFRLSPQGQLTTIYSFGDYNQRGRKHKRIFAYWGLFRN